MTHICVSKLTIIGSDNGLLPERRQAIIWTSAEILLIGPLGTNFSEISIAVQTFSFKKMHLKMSSAKWRPLCLGHNVLNHVGERGHRASIYLALRCPTARLREVLEAVRLGVRMIVLFLNLTCASAILLLKNVSNCRTIGQV